MGGKPLQTMGRNLWYCSKEERGDLVRLDSGLRHEALGAKLTPQRDQGTP